MILNNISDVTDMVSTVNSQYETKASNLQATLLRASQEGDYSRAKSLIEQFLNEMGELQAQLQEALAQLTELEANQARQEQYSETWWQQERQVLHETFSSQPQEGASRWLQTYAGALIAWQIGICKKLVIEPFPFPEQLTHTLHLVQHGTQAIEEETYLSALPMLHYLAQSDLAGSDRAALLIFMGRIYLYKALEYTKARELFERAQELVPNDGLPSAALGDYYQSQQDSSTALSLYQQAIRLSPSRPNGYIGLGLLAENRAAWDEAADWYSEAIEAVREEKDIEAVLGKLLAPVSGNLYLQLARTQYRRSDKERALQAVTRAISMGIKDRQAYPERISYRLKGEILADLDRRTEAAEAYYEAGRRFGWLSETQTAIKLLSSAQGLSPDDARFYWELADAWRVDSYRPDPPYVNKTSINNSLAAWEAAAASKQQPTGEWTSIYSWHSGYGERALINEQLARLSGTSRWSLWWEAITYLERALLLNETEPQYWMLLGRYYRSLEMNASALRATAKAVSDRPDNTAVLDERAAILANLGKFDEAEEMIDKRRTLEPNVWADCLKAYILLRTGFLDEAIRLVEGAVKEQPADIWFRSLLALCYRLHDRPEDARKKYESIWSDYQESDLGNRGSFGWAAYHLDKLDEAITIYRSLLDEPIDIGDTYWSLGLCYLARGDVVLGEDYLDKGVARAKNGRQLDDMVTFDLHNLELSSIHRPYYAQIQETLVPIKQRIASRRREIEQWRIAEDAPEAVEEELKQVISEQPLKDGEIDWAWIGAQGGLARLYVQQERWSESGTTYQLLQKEGQHFPEALDGLTHIFDTLQARGDAVLKEGRFPQTLEQFRGLWSLNLSHGDLMRQGELCSRLGYVYFCLTDIDNARSHFASAIHFFQESDTASSGSALGSLCASLLQDAVRYWDLDTAWAVMSDDPVTDEALRRALPAARTALDQCWDSLYQLSEQYLNSSERSLALPPIVLELGQALTPVGPFEKWPLVATYIPAMRQRLKESMGVTIPGITIRDNVSLAPEEYVFLLSEVSLLRSSVPLDMRYCPLPPEALTAHGIPDEDLKSASHPLTGDPGFWVHHRSWERSLASNLELWDDPFIFIVYHLQTVLFRHLAELLDMQEVENLLTAWGKSEGAQLLINTALPDQRARFLFGMVLRTLLREYVPVTEWKDLLEAVSTIGLAGENIFEAVRLARLRLKSSLPGNKPHVRLLELSTDAEDFLRSLTQQEVEVTSTAQLPKAQELTSFQQGLQGAVRSAIGASNRWLALVTHSFELRPVIEEIIQGLFSDIVVVVMAKEELLIPEEVTACTQEEEQELEEGGKMDG